MPSSKRKSPPNISLVQFTDDALALEFYERYQKILVTKPRNSYLFDGKVWVPESGGALGHALVRNFLREKAKQLSPETMQRTILMLGSRRKADDVERMTRSNPAAIENARNVEFDADEWLLNTPGGVVDLRTGLLREALPEDYCSKLTKVAPSETEACPRWLQFIDEITGGDKEFAAYLKCVAGYSLTGSVRDEGLFFFYGGGGSGKGTYLQTQEYVLGDYAGTIAHQTLMTSKNDRHPAELMVLKGLRLAITPETNHGEMWHEAKIKALSSTDTITARRMRADFESFLPTHKLVVSSNNMPSLPKVDSAIRRRFHVVPFVQDFPKRGTVDPGLKEKLRLEAPGILRWMINGCLDWQSDGLKQPEVVRECSQTYFAEHDDMQEWFNLNWEISADSSKRTAYLPIFASWQAWQEARGKHAGTQDQLTECLIQNFPKISRVKTTDGRQRALNVAEKSPSVFATPVG